jgi:phosphoglycerate transport regulatory protein PgtC
LNDRFSRATLTDKYLTMGMAMAHKWTTVAALCLIASAAPAAAQTTAGATQSGDRVVVLTSYPEELTTRYQHAFEAAHPGIDVQIVWAHSADARKRLDQPGDGGVDVYWTPSPATFAALAAAGRFASLPVDRQQLPGRIGSQPISDPANRFQAFEVAGYGLAVNEPALRRLGLPVPTHWSDLATPAYAGLTLWPDPVHTGFAPALYDIVLQGQGWQGGWALLSEAVVAGRLSAHGGGIVDQVVDGPTPIGASVDFMVRSAAAEGRPVQMVYPDKTAFLPANVALLAHAPHPQAARAFADYVLSAAGQALLFDPDIARYPVRPAAYTQAPAGTFDPFGRPDAASFAYDPALAQARSGLEVALFEAAIADRIDTLAPLWKALHAAEARQRSHPDPAVAARLAQARQLLGAVPVSERQADESALQSAFRRADDAMHDAAGGSAGNAAILAQWRAVLDRNARQARALLDGVPAA